MKKYYLLILLAFSGAMAYAGSSRGIVVKVQLNCAMAGDTVTLSLWQTLYDINKQAAQQPDHYVQATLKNGYFEMNIPDVSSTGYMVLAVRNSDRNNGLGRPIILLENYTYEPGDDITVVFDSLGVVQKSIATGGVRQYKLRGFRFSGEGVSKYILKQQLDSIPGKYDKEAFAKAGGKANPNRIDVITIKENQNRHGVEIIALQSAMIQAAAISDAVRRRLLLDVSGKWYSDQTRSFWSTYSHAKGKSRDTLSTYYDTSRYYRWHINPKDPMLASSVYISEYVCMKAQVDHRLLKNQPAAYDAIHSMFEGDNRQFFITALLFRYFESIDSNEHYLKKAYQSVTHKQHRDILDELSTTLARGSKAFAFRLIDQKGDTRSLEEFRGKVVLMDFWYTGCGGCIQYYKVVLSRMEHDLRNDTGIVFLPVSIDSKAIQWKNSIRGGFYTAKDAANVINLYTGGKGNDHPVIKNYKVVGYPRPILIDPKGNIAESNSRKLRTYDELLRSILAAKK